MATPARSAGSRASSAGRAAAARTPTVPRLRVPGPRRRAVRGRHQRGPRPSAWPGRRLASPPTAARASEPRPRGSRSCRA
eukprot:5808989-Pyramimonas_sp.AAC.1